MSLSVASGGTRIRPEFQCMIDQADPAIKFRGYDELISHARNEMGIPDLTRYALKKAVMDRTLEHFLISGAIYFSERGLVRWLVGQVRGGEPTKSNQPR